MIHRLEDHFIICGYGRVRRRAAEEFATSGERYVGLDTGGEAIEAACDRGVLDVQGSDDDESLEDVFAPGGAGG